MATYKKENGKWGSCNLCFAGFHDEDCVVISTTFKTSKVCKKCSEKISKLFEEGDKDEQP